MKSFFYTTFVIILFVSNLFSQENKIVILYDEANVQPEERGWYRSISSCGNVCKAISSYNGDYLRVLRSDDKGKNWYIEFKDTIKRLNNSTNLTITNGTFKFNKTLVGTSSGYIFLQKDLNSPFKLISTPIKEQITNVDIYDNYLFISSATSIYQSSDFGVSWEEILKHDLYDAHFAVIDSNNYIFIGRHDTCYYYDDIQKTTNKGKTWLTYKNIFKDSDYLIINGLFFLNSIGYIYGREPNGSTCLLRDLILKTTDLGLTWNPILEKSDVDALSLTTVSFFDSLNAVAVGDKCDIIKTSNGGITWEKIKLDNRSLLGRNIQCGWTDDGNPLIAFSSNTTFGIYTIGYKTGIENKPINSPSVIYPNPVSAGKTLFIKSENSVISNIKIMDFIGNIITYESGNQISLPNNLIDGIYFIQFNDGDIIKHDKIIITH